MDGAELLEKTQKGEKEGIKEQAVSMNMQGMGFNCLYSYNLRKIRKLRAIKQSMQKITQTQMTQGQKM